MAFIILNIEDSHLYMSQNFLTSKELWDHLKKYFQAKSLSRHAALCRQLTNIEKSREETIAEYFSRSKALLREILEIDTKAVSDLTFINIVLNGLTEEYDVAVQLLQSQDEDLTFEKIVAPIVNVEQMLNNKSSASANTSSTALISKNFTKKPKTFCRYCKKPGHDISQCRALKKKRENSKEKEETHISLATTATLQSPEEWILDSGCTQHMSFRRDLFQTYEEDNTVIRTANGEIMTAIGRGKVTLYPNGKDCTQKLILNDVLYVKDLKFNLLSTGKMTDAGAQIHLDDSHATIYKNNQIVLTAERSGTVYKAELAQSPKDYACSATSNDIWHKRFGHIGSGTLLRTL